MKKILTLFVFGFALMFGVVFAIPEQDVFASTTSYTIVYEMNAPENAKNTSGTANSSTWESAQRPTLENGTVFNVPGYTFIGWKIQGTTTILQPGAQEKSISTIASNAGISGTTITLLAQWEKSEAPDTSFDWEFLSIVLKAFCITSVMFVFLLAICRVANKQN